MIVRETVARIYWRNYGWLSQWADAFSGVRDGLVSQPNPEEALGSIRFYRGILNKEIRVFSRLVAMCERALAKARKRLSVLRADQLSAEHNKAAAQALSELEAYCEEKGISTPQESKLNQFYFYIMSMLALIETPINIPAFQIFFTGSLVIAAFPAFLVGIILMYSAHLTGSALKDLSYAGKEEKDGAQPGIAGLSPQVWRIVAVVGLVAFMAVVIFLLAKVRQVYADYQSSQTSDNLSALFEQGVVEFVNKGFATELRLEGYLLVMLNSALVVFGIILAAAHRMGDPHLRRLWERYKNLHEIAILRHSVVEARDELLNFRMERARFVLHRLTVYRDANYTVRRRGTEIKALHNIHDEEVADQIFSRSEILGKFS